jgi:hypothetical protein
MGPDRIGEPHGPRTSMEPASRLAWPTTISRVPATGSGVRFETAEPLGGFRSAQRVCVS